MAGGLESLYGAPWAIKAARPKTLRVATPSARTRPPLPVLKCPTFARAETVDAATRSEPTSVSGELARALEQMRWSLIRVCVCAGRPRANVFGTALRIMRLGPTPASPQSAAHRFAK